MSYADLYEVEGDMLQMRTDGKVRQQGSKYIVSDGDIIDFKVLDIKATGATKLNKVKRIIS